MVRSWQASSQRQVTVTHAATEYVLESISVIVRRRENGFDTGTVIIDDDKASNYDLVAADDAIKIEQKDASESSWTTILDGVIRRVDPIIQPSGSVLKLECDGAGYGLNIMLCGDEYGSEVSASLDTIKEIVEDNNNGIIDAWANSVLGDTGTASGHSYTTQVETIAGTVPYIYFPFKPCSKAINDVCDIVQAIKGTNAGPHWIVDTSDRFLLATVGNHGAPASTFWSTWWRTDQATSTLAEGMDFVSGRFEQLSKEANYVLYSGDITKPLDLDSWTNNNSGSWGTSANLTISDDAANHAVGTHSIKLTMNNAAGGTGVAYYPSTMDLGLNVDAMGGDYSFPFFHAWAMLDSTFYGDTDNKYYFTFFTDAGNTYYVGDDRAVTRTFPIEDDKFAETAFPIGTNWKLRQSDLPLWLHTINSGGGDWTDINAVGLYIVFDAAANGSEVWIDGMYITGTVLRAARQSAAYSSSDPCKTKIITDSVAKDDTMNASDDSGLVGRLVYAEYLRASSSPMVGSLTIPIAPDLLPGQQVHIHAKKTITGSFKIDDDFRVLRLTHEISPNGYFTHLEVTDDLKNANPRPVPNRYNVLLGAVRPESQDRQASSIKLRDIDITQTILEKSY